MPPKEKHTDPRLRNDVKEEIHGGDKNGAPCQWTASKAQMMASEYKKRGSDYNQDKSQKDESQENLSKRNWDGQQAEGEKSGQRSDGKKQAAGRKGNKSNSGKKSDSEAKPTTHSSDA